MFNRSITRGVALAAVLVAGACAPSDGGGGTPTAPVWTSTYTGDVSQSADTGGTTADWYVQYDNNLSGSTVLRFFPRTGVSGDTLGTPQSFPVVGTGSPLVAPVMMAEHTFVGGGTAAENSPPLGIYTENGGTWSLVGSFTRAPSEQLMAVADGFIVTQDRSDYLNQKVKVYSLVANGAGVTPTLTQTLTADPAGGPGAASSFGLDVAMEGDLMVIGGGAEGASAPNRDAQGVVYRNLAGTWTFETALIGAGPYPSNISVAVDDRGASERVAIGTFGLPGSVTLFGGTSGVWTQEAVVTQPTNLPDEGLPGQPAFNAFGALVGLDGDLLIVGYRNEPVPSGLPGGADRIANRMSVFHRAAGGWTFERSLDTLPTPLPADALNFGPIAIQLSGSHLVASAMLGLPIPVGGLPFNFRTQAWRYDRT